MRVKAYCWIKGPLAAMVPLMSPMCSPFINQVNSFTRVIEILKFGLAFLAQLQCPYKLQSPTPIFTLLYINLGHWRICFETWKESCECASACHNSPAPRFTYFSIALTGFTAFFSTFPILTTKRSRGSGRYTRDKKAHTTVVNKSGYHLGRTVSKHHKPIHNSHAARTNPSCLKIPTRYEIIMCHYFLIVTLLTY